MLKATTFILLFLLPQISLSSISIDNAVINMHEKVSETLSVKNSGENKEYIAVNIRRLNNPGTKNESCSVLNKGNYQKFTKMCEEKEDIKDIGLSISPLKFILNPDSSRKLKIFNISESDKERIYRAEVVPVSAPFSIEGKKKVGVKIQIGYEALIIIPPKNLKFSYETHRSGKKLNVKNTGNSNILFYNGKVCNEKECKKIKPKRIYSGATHMFELPLSDGKVSFDIMKNKRTERIEI